MKSTLARQRRKTRKEPLCPQPEKLIRLMNYIDDIATTLRRISASIPR